MHIKDLLNDLDSQSIKTLIDDVSRSIIKDPNINQQTVIKSLSVIETIIALNAVYDFNTVNLIIDNESKMIVLKRLEAYFNTSLKYQYLSNHPSDVLGVSLAIALESERKTVVLMDNFSMNYGKSFESLIQLNKHKPNLNVVFFDPLNSLFNNQPTSKSWLNSLRMSQAYTSLKKDVKGILSNPVGQPILETLTKVKESMKEMLLEPTVFTQFGFNYHGPIQGNQYKDNLKVFTSLKDFQGLHLIHIKSDQQNIQNLQLPSFKLEDGVPENYITYIDAIDEVLSHYDNLIVCTDISKDREHMAQFAIKFPDHYYVSAGTIQSFVDFAKGLLMLDKRVVLIVSSYQFKHVIPLIEEQLSSSKNILFILRDSGLNVGTSRIKQGVFDIAFSSYLTDKIYMGRNLDQALGLLHYTLNQENFDLTILRIPSSLEKRELGDAAVSDTWELLNKDVEPTAVIFSYGPTVSNVYNKIKVNNMNIWLVDCKSIFNIDQNIIELVNSKNIPVIVYDLEDIYHTLYRKLENAVHAPKILNFSLKNTNLNLNAKDLKQTHHLNVEHILNALE